MYTLIMQKYVGWDGGKKFGQVVLKKNPLKDVMKSWGSWKFQSSVDDDENT